MRDDVSPHLTSVPPAHAAGRSVLTLKVSSRKLLMQFIFERCSVLCKLEHCYLLNSL